MEEQERRQRELREKLARAQSSNAQGMYSRETMFGPVDDYVERRRPLTRLFFSVYDNLGGLIVVNLLTFVLTLPLLFVLLIMLQHPRSVGVFLPLLIVGLIAPPAWAAASSYCAKVVEAEPHALRDYLTDYRRFSGRAILLALGQWIVGGALLYATGWYLGQHVAALKTIGVVSLYLFLFWALTSLYLWPLLVRGYRWRAIVRNAVVLVLAAPVRSLGILLFLAVCSIVFIATGIGVVVLFFSLWAMLPNQALILTRERLEERSARNVKKSERAAENAARP